MYYKANQVLPLGQLQQLWVVSISSTRGPHEDHAQLILQLTTDD